MGADALPRSAAGPHSPWLIAVIVSIATFMEVLDTTIANVALRHIAGSVGAGEDEATYILTSYLVSNAIVLTISGWLMNVIGRKRFYMISVAIFTISSIGCGLSNSLGMILFFRVLQGIGGGGLAPVEQSIFADSFPPAKRALAFSLYGFTVVTAPAIGPSLGGWLTDNYSWHWVFLINLPVGLISLALTGIFVSDSALVKKERETLLKKGLRIDYVGFALAALGFGALQIVLDRFEREDGFSSDYILILSAVAAFCLLFLLVWDYFHPQPVLNVRLFAIRPFAISCVVMFIFGFVIISTTQLLPQLSQQLLGYDATTAGMTLSLGGLITILIMPLSGILTGRVIQPRWAIFFALAGTSYALYWASTLDLTADFEALSMSRMIQVIWLPFIFIPLSAVQFIGVPPERNNEASAIINLMRNLGGSWGVSVTTTVLLHHNQIRQTYLVEHITPFTGYPLGSNLQAIARTVQEQAQMLSYIDVFLLLSAITLCLCPLALFLPSVPKGAPRGH